MAAFRVGMIGAGFITDVHIEAIKTIGHVEVAALANRGAARGARMCRKHGVAQCFTSHNEMLKKTDVDMVWVNLPNNLHAQVAMDVLKAGRHVVIEKPLALSLTDCDRLIDLAAKEGRVIGYAEELCYAPKNVEAKRRADQGAIGDVFFVKQLEKHGGAYSPWFFQSRTAGGGILMDMGCHSIECCRWLLGKPRATAVWAHMDKYVHHKSKWKSQVEDHVVMHIEFETGATALVESSWTLLGGMSSKLEMHGTGGVLYGDLLQDGTGLKLYSEKGYGPRGERREQSGWHHADWDWQWANGYPQEDRDFIEAAKTGRRPVESAEDGRAVLEIMLAGYQSAGTGRVVQLPFTPPRGTKVPVDLWLKNRGSRRFGLK